MFLLQLIIDPVNKELEESKQKQNCQIEGALQNGLSIEYGMLLL